MPSDSSLITGKMLPCWHTIQRRAIIRGCTCTFKEIMMASLLSVTLIFGGESEARRTPITRYINDKVQIYSYITDIARCYTSISVFD